MLLFKETETKPYLLSGMLWNYHVLFFYFYFLQIQFPKIQAFLPFSFIKKDKHPVYFCSYCLVSHITESMEPVWYVSFLAWDVIIWFVHHALF